VWSLNFGSTNFNSEQLGAQAVLLLRTQEMANLQVQELVDMIIDDLKDEKWVLHSCSLVCRSWAPTCQRHIFRRTVLFPPCWDSYLRRRTGVSYSKRLLEVLRRSPHVVDYIRVLYIFEQNWIATDETLPLLLRQLTNLARLEFRRLSWDSLGSDLKESLCAVLENPRMTYLEIGEAHFGNLDNLEALLHHAKALTGLSLKSNYRLESCTKDRGDQEGLGGTNEKGSNSVQQRHLVDLRLNLGDEKPFLDWLLGPRSPYAVSRIQTLHIEPYSSVVDGLLQAIGDSLKECKIAMIWCE
jgi:hypothetical protein